MPMPDTPTLTCTKSTRPASSSRAAISAASSAVRPAPSRCSSSPTSRIPTATPSPTAARTASGTSTPRRIRFSRLPPYSSVRWLLLGERNSWIRYPWAPCTSIPSNPPAAALAAERAKYSTSSRISSRSKALERDEIRELVEYFARSAANAAAGGFDGIEVHGAHGYLIHEFLSPKSNHRTDEYGGSLENRMRLGVEVPEAVRTAVGDGVAVGIRLVGDEEQRDGAGLTADDAAEIAARLEDAGLVDFVHVSVGVAGMGMVR